MDYNVASWPSKSKNENHATRYVDNKSGPFHVTYPKKRKEKISITNQAHGRPNVNIRRPIENAKGKQNTKCNGQPNQTAAKKWEKEREKEKK